MGSYFIPKFWLPSRNFFLFQAPNLVRKSKFQCVGGIGPQWVYIVLIHQHEAIEDFDHQEDFTLCEHQFLQSHSLLAFCCILMLPLFKNFFKSLSANQSSKIIIIARLQFLVYLLLICSSNAECYDMGPALSQEQFCEIVIFRISNIEERVQRSNLPLRAQPILF